jgi:hypothetical protein
MGGTQRGDVSNRSASIKNFRCLMKNLPFRSPFASFVASALLLTAAMSGHAQSQSNVEARALPQTINSPTRNVTDFSFALRCMDEKLLEFGVRDVVFALEDLQDNTKKLSVGTRDMMVSAISDMTRRSRAVRLITFGNDNQTVVNLLQQLEKKSPFGVMPQFDIRGSVSQLDEDVVKQQTGFGAALAGVFGIKFGKSTQINVLGFDASVITVPELTLVPGVTTRNQVIVVREDAAASDGLATIQKVGVSFSFGVLRSTGNAQALRSMIELGAVELVGRALRLPYWSCLGTPEAHPDVRRELEDWFISMRAGTERNTFFQEHLRHRKFFDGPLDGKSTPQLTEALALYKKGLGFADSAPTDLNFFTAFITRTVPTPPDVPFFVESPKEEKKDGAVLGVVEAAGSDKATPAALTAPDATTKVATAAIAADLKLFGVKQSVRVDQSMPLEVLSNQNGYLYCYLQNVETQKIQRFYPNRLVRDPRIEANKRLAIPGKRKFRVAINTVGAHAIGCLHAPREVYNDLPPPLRWGDFEDIKAKSLEEIQTMFANASKLPIALQRVEFTVTK